MTGRGQTIAACSAVIFFFVGSLSVRCHSDNYVAPLYMTVINHVCTFHAASHGAVDDDRANQIAHIGRSQIHGMVHCSGGAQTKVMHFVENKRVTKNNLFPVPPLFRIIQEQSGTDWSEMYKVFNMGHRMEIYLSPEHAEEVISIAKSFNIDAQIVGFVEEADKNELIIESEKGRFVY